MAPFGATQHIICAHLAPDWTLHERVRKMLARMQAESSAAWIVFIFFAGSFKTWNVALHICAYNYEILDSDSW
jgi:hypothetical protein